MINLHLVAGFTVASKLMYFNCPAASGGSLLFSTNGYPVFPAPLLKRLSFLQHDFGFFVKNQIFLDSWNFLCLLLYSIGLCVCFCANNCIAFIIIALYYNLKHSIVMSLVLLLLLRIALAILSLF